MTDERKIRAALKVDASQIRLPHDLLERINGQVVMDAPSRTSRGLRRRLGPALEAVVACIVLTSFVGLAAFRNLSHSPSPATGQVVHTPPPHVAAPTGAPWIEPDAQFAAPLADQLSRSGIVVIEVRRSVYESFFPQFHQAAWIKTDQGILQVVFFDNEQEAHAVQVREGTATVGHLYEITMGDWLQRVSTDRPLFFTTSGNLWAFSESAVLVAAMKRM